MHIDRYIVIKAIKIEDEFIPIWDERIMVCKDDDEDLLYEHCKIKFNDIDCGNFIIECLYDLINKEIHLGEVVEIYPSIEKSKFKINDNIVCEVSYDNVKLGKIKDIIFEEYDIDIHKGIDLIKYYSKNEINVEIKKDNFYILKNWKMAYLLYDDSIIYNVHNLKHLLS